MIQLLENKEDNNVLNTFSNIIKNTSINKEQYTELFIEKVKQKYNYLDYGVLYNSCSNALIATILALGIKRNDEVIIPTYTCKSILDVLVLLGLKPVLVDCYLDYEKSNFNPNLKQILNIVSKNTKLIIIPYNFGYVSEYNDLYSLGIPIIEDITLVFGAKLLNNKDHNRIIISSFHKSKVLSSIEGGIVLTNNNELYINLLKGNDCFLTNVKERYIKRDDIQYILGNSFRQSYFNTILGYLNLENIDINLNKRLDIAKTYCSKINNKNIIIPIFDSSNIYYRFIIGVRNGGALSLLKYLLNNGVECGRGIYPLISDYVGDTTIYLNAEKAIKMSVSIPIYPSLSNDEINKIILLINNYKG